MNHFNKISSIVGFGLIIFIIFSVNIIRFVGLEKSPPGFHVDELGGAVSMTCLAMEGIDGRSRPYPLFSDLTFGTPKPPTAIYFAIPWVKIFGSSIASFRAMSAFAAVMSILGLFFLARQFWTTAYGLMVALVASISPWAWVFSRINYEPMWAPCYLVWGLYFLFRTPKVWSYALSGLCLSLAMYSYPPMRAQVPLMTIVLAGFVIYRKEWKWAPVIAFVTTLILVTLPVFIKTIRGDFNTRFDLVGITSEKYLASIGKTASFFDLGGIVFQNYLLHFKSMFLFISGDQNIMHSTQFSGLLSWVEVFALVCGMFILAFVLGGRILGKKLDKLSISFLVFLLVNIAIGILPAALTWEGLPHSLRILGAWPFVSLLTGFCLWRAFKRFPSIVIIIAIIASVFMWRYLDHYFKVYPKMSYGMFSTWAKDQSSRAKTDIDWLKFMEKHHPQDFHVRYYLMRYRDLSCSEALHTYDDFMKLYWQIRKK